MARELKFRTWNRNAQGWIDLAVSGPPGPMGALLNELIKAAQKSCDFMQYTGMLDKNGVEIYEGDVVLRNNYSNYIVDLDNNGWLGMYYDLPSEEYEVIGNIYNNPDLLKDCE